MQARATRLLHRLTEKHIWHRRRRMSHKVATGAFGSALLAYIAVFGWYAPIPAAAASPAWSATTLPVPVGALAASPAAISCTSSTSCTTVGPTIIPSPVGAGVNYNSWVSTLSGSNWSETTVPTVAGSNQTDLSGASCVAPTFCVAVGQYHSDPVTVSGPVVETLNGSRWTPTGLSAPAGPVAPSLTGVSCSAVTSCVAIGTNLQSGSTPQPFIETLAGSTWSLGNLPLPAGAGYATVSGISCTLPTSCVAVGTAFPSETGFADVLSGSVWTPMIPALPAGTANDELTSVSCVSPTACTAAGNEVGGAHITGALVETFNGASWTPTALPSRTVFGVSPLQISCASKSSCVVVGNDQIGPVAISLSGASWTENALPIPAGYTNFQPQGVSCPQSAVCTVVGYSQTGPDAQVPVVETNGFRFPSAFVGLAGTSSGSGYLLARSDGWIWNYGDAAYLGSMGGQTLNAPTRGIASTGDGGGYWELGSDGGIFSFGDAGFYGSTGSLRLNQPVQAMARSGDSHGYWLAAGDGGVFAYGDAQFFGSLPGLGVHVSNVDGLSPTSDGAGYWMVGSDGGVFAFGEAGFVGSLPGLSVHVNDVVGIGPTSDGGGYWMVGSDGGVFAFGDAGYLGSLPGLGVHVNNIVGISPTPDNRGYWLLGSDGGVFAFGDAGFYGSAG